MKERYEANSKKIFKLPEKIELPKQELNVNYTKEEIINAYKNIIEKNSERLNKNAKNIEKIAITENYTVASKVKDMFRALFKNKKFVFNNLFSINKCNKQEVVTAFTGLLELSRRSKVVTEQEETFGDILVQKVNKNKT